MRRALALLLVPALFLAACSKQEDPKKSTSGGGYTAGSTPPPAAPPHVPLTQADVDKYVAMSLDFYRAPKTPAGRKPVLEKHGMTDNQFGALYQRVTDAKNAYGRNQKIGEAIPPHLVADVEVYKANMERIAAAGSGKELPPK